MTLYFLTEIDGVWHYRQNGMQVWHPVTPNCRSLLKASRIVKGGDPRAMVAVVPRFNDFEHGNAAG